MEIKDINLKQVWFKGSLHSVMVSVFGLCARGSQFESWSDLLNFFLIEDTKNVSKCCYPSGVTILSICSSWGDNIDNIVTPRGKYTKINSDLRSNEHLSNVYYVDSSGRLCILGYSHIRSLLFIFKQMSKERVIWTVGYI